MATDTAAPKPKESDELAYWRDKGVAVNGAKFDHKIFESKLSEEDLLKNKDWVRACRMVHELYEGKPKPGKELSDKEVAEWGVSQMRWINTNTSSIGNAGLKILGGSATKDQKMAFMYMMDAFEHKDATAMGVAKGVVSGVFDWANLAGVGFGGVASKLVAKTAFKEGIKKAIGYTITAGLESTLQTTTEQAVKQNVAVETDRQAGGWDNEKFAKNLAMNTGANLFIGKVAFPALGAGFKWAGNKLTASDAHLASASSLSLWAKFRMKKEDSVAAEKVTQSINKWMQHGRQTDSRTVDALIKKHGLTADSSAAKVIKEKAAKLEEKAKLFVTTEEGRSVTLADARKFVSTPLPKLLNSDAFKAGQVIKTEANLAYKAEARVINYDTAGSALVNQAQFRLLANIHYSSAPTFQAWMALKRATGFDFKVSNMAKRLPRMFMEEKFFRPVIRAVDTAINESGLVPESVKLEQAIQKISRDLATPGDLATKRSAAKSEIGNAFQEFADRNSAGLHKLEEAVNVRIKELQAIGYQKDASGKSVRRDASSEAGPDRISKLPGEELIDQKQYEYMMKYLEDIRNMAISLRAGNSPSNIYMQEFVAKINSASDTSNDLAVGAANRIGRLGTDVRMRLADLYNGEKTNVMVRDESGKLVRDHKSKDFIDRDGNVIDTVIPHENLVSHLIYKLENNLSAGYYGSATDWKPVIAGDDNMENQFSALVHYVDGLKKKENGDVDWLPADITGFKDIVTYFVNNNQIGHLLHGMRMLQMNQGILNTAPLNDSGIKNIAEENIAKFGALSADGERWAAVLRQARWVPEEAYAHGERDVLKNFRLGGFSLFDWQYFKYGSLMSAAADSKWNFLGVPGWQVPFPKPGAPGFVMMDLHKSRIRANVTAFLTGGEVVLSPQKGNDGKTMSLYSGGKGNPWFKFRPDATAGSAHAAEGEKALQKLHLPNTPENNTRLARMPRALKILDNATGAGLPTFLATGGLFHRDNGKLFSFNQNAWWHFYAPASLGGLTRIGIQSLFNDPSESDIDVIKDTANYISLPARAMTYAYPYAIGMTPLLGGALVDGTVWGVSNVVNFARDGNFDAPAARLPHIWQFGYNTMTPWADAGAERVRDILYLDTTADIKRREQEAAERKRKIEAERVPGSAPAPAAPTQPANGAAAESGAVNANPQTLDDVKTASKAITADATKISGSVSQALGEFETNFLTRLQKRIADVEAAPNDAQKDEKLKNLKKLEEQFPEYLEQVKRGSLSLKQLQALVASHNTHIEQLDSAIQQEETLADAKAKFGDQKESLIKMKAANQNIENTIKAFETALANGTALQVPPRVAAPAAASTTTGAQPQQQAAGGTTTAAPAPAPAATPEQTALNTARTIIRSNGQADTRNYAKVAENYVVQIDDLRKDTIGLAKPFRVMVEHRNANGGATEALLTVMAQAEGYEKTATEALTKAIESQKKIAAWKAQSDALVASTDTAAQAVAIQKAEELKKQILAETNKILSADGKSGYLVDARVAKDEAGKLLNQFPQYKEFADSRELRGYAAAASEAATGTSSQKTLLNKGFSGEDGAPSLLDRGANFITNSFNGLSKWWDKVGDAAHKKGRNHETWYQVGNAGIVGIFGLIGWNVISSISDSLGLSKDLNSGWTKWLALGAIAAVIMNQDGKVADRFDAMDQRDRERNPDLARYHSMVGQTQGRVTSHAPTVLPTATITTRNGAQAAVVVPDTQSVAATRIQSEAGEPPRTNVIDASAEFEARRLAAQTARTGSHGAQLGAGTADVVASNGQPATEVSDARQAVIRDGRLSANDGTPFRGLANA